MNPEEIGTAILLTIGMFFMFVGSLGIIRMPDLFMRMSATTKSATLGVSFTLLAAALHFAGDLGNATRIIATIVFLFITAPVAAHMIGRAAYFSGVELWHGTVADELEGRYDHEHDRLVSRPPQSQETQTQTHPS